MTVRRRGRRIKTGAGSYVNLNGKGEMTSQTFKSGSTTFTAFTKGGTRTTRNFGDGYYDVVDTRRGRSSRPRGRRGRSDDGLAFEVVVALATFLARSAWRLGAWGFGVAWRSYMGRRDARRAALPPRPVSDA